MMMINIFLLMNALFLNAAASPTTKYILQLSASNLVSSFNPFDSKTEVILSGMISAPSDGYSDFRVSISPIMLPSYSEDLVSIWRGFISLNTDRSYKIDLMDSNQRNLGSTEFTSGEALSNGPSFTKALICADKDYLRAFGDCGQLHFDVFKFHLPSKRAETGRESVESDSDVVKIKDNVCDDPMDLDLTCDETI